MRTRMSQRALAPIALRGRRPAGARHAVARWGVTLGTLGALLLGSPVGPAERAAAGLGPVGGASLDAASLSTALPASLPAAAPASAAPATGHGAGEHGEHGDDHGDSLAEQLAHVAIGGFVVVGGGIALWRERRAARRRREADGVGGAPQHP